jgi:hypothetical protein
LPLATSLTYYALTRICHFTWQTTWLTT